MACCGTAINKGDMVVTIKLPNAGLPGFTSYGVTGVGMFLDTTVYIVTPSGAIAGPVSFDNPFTGLSEEIAQLISYHSGPGVPAGAVPYNIGTRTQRIYDPDCIRFANVSVTAAFTGVIPNLYVQITYHIDSPYFTFADQHTTIPTLADNSHYYDYGSWFRLGILGDMAVWTPASGYTATATVAYNGTTAAPAATLGGWSGPSSPFSNYPYTDPGKYTYVFMGTTAYSGFPVVTCSGDNPTVPVVTGDPVVNAWGFSLHNHDYYVIPSVGLIYDLSTDKWSEWKNNNMDHLRAIVGQNWVGMTTTLASFGSDVVAGDESTGVLWIFDPSVGMDDLTTTGNETFPRSVTGGVQVVGRNTVPCGAVTLDLALGNPAQVGSTVALDISDDLGKTFTNVGSVTIAAGSYNEVVEFRSLGQIGAPGRIFRISDAGASVRIGGANMR